LQSLLEEEPAHSALQNLFSSTVIGRTVEVKARQGRSS
jgi:hypothetical protein